MADRVVNTTDTLNYFRHEFNGTAEDVGDIQSILDAQVVLLLRQLMLLRLL